MTLQKQIFNDVNSRDYVEFLAENNLDLDIYYDPNFLKLDARMQGGEHEVFSARKGSACFVYPYIKLPFAPTKEGRFDITSPYGYCGPYCNEPAFFDEAESAFIEHIVESGCVCEFIRYHYLYNETMRFRQSVVNTHNRNVVLLNLSQDWDSIWNLEFSSTNRNLIRKCDKEGYQYEMSGDPEAIDEFIGMYYETMKKVSAPRFYYFDRNYFYQLFDSCSDNVVLARIVKAGKTFASALFFSCNGVMTYYLSARNLDYPKVPAGNALLARTAEWARSRGTLWLNFGGGHTASNEDSLFRYKKNFCTNSVPFFIGKRVHDKDVYRELTEAYVAKQGGAKYDERKHILQFYREADINTGGQE